MMCVGKMRVEVRQRFVAVPMRMRFYDIFRMFVLMMLVVDVFVLVFEQLMGMPMLMAFGQMQPHAGGRQRAGQHERRRDGFSDQRNGDRRPNERCDREIVGPCVRCRDGAARARTRPSSARS